MSTINYASSTNNGNSTVWSFSTKIAFNTDRPSGTHARGAEVESVENLGVGVTVTDLFTLLS